MLRKCGGRRRHDRLPLKATHCTTRGKYESHHPANSASDLSLSLTTINVRSKQLLRPRFSHPAPHDDSSPSHTYEISLILPSEKDFLADIVARADRCVVDALARTRTRGIAQSGRLGSWAIGGLGHWHTFVVNLSGSISLISPSVHRSRICCRQAASLLHTRVISHRPLFPS